VPEADQPLPHLARALPASLTGGTERTLHVLVPYIPAGGVYGGVATALRLAVELAHQGENVHVVETEYSDRLDDDGLRAALQRSLDAPDDWVRRLTFASPAADRRPLSIGPRDVFLATAWWTAHRAHWTNEQLGFQDRKFAYLVQDFEPLFYPSSDQQVLADWTYRMPCWPLVNCTTLADYFRQFTGLPVEDDMVLAPQVDVPALRALPRPATDGGPLRVLVYGRPTVARNLFETAVRGLALWLTEREPDREVQIVSAGELHPDVDLGDGVTMSSLGQLPWPRYLEELSRCHLGVSLMLSPHPSYPPLEMAAAGLGVVTNRFACKDLSALSPRFVSCDPTSFDVARALTEAEAKLPDLAGVDRHLDLSPLGRPLPDVVTALRERLDSYSARM
jgi:hypothetical protein